MDKEIILVGAFSEMIDLCLECGFNIIGYIDNQESTYPACQGNFLGTDDDISSIYKKYRDIPVVISPDQPSIRKKLYAKYKEAGFKFQTLISPFAHISNSAVIGEGTVIQHGVTVSSNAHIGDFVKLNVNANVMHDCCVDDFTTIAPNAVLLGKVSIGTATYIGANSTILPYCKVSANTIIGAGAVVVSDSVASGTYVGVPAKKIK